jgi:hypothetical protein
MKRATFFLLFAFAAVSCRKTINTPPAPACAPSIIGNWNSTAGDSVNIVISATYMITNGQRALPYVASADTIYYFSDRTLTPMYSYSLNMDTLKLWAVEPYASINTTLLRK